MRVWIEHLFNSTAAHADFLKYVSEIEVKLNKDMKNALLANETEAAKGFAHELKFYEGLRDLFKGEVREQQNTVAFRQNI